MKNISKRSILSILIVFISVVSCKNNDTKISEETLSTDIEKTKENLTTKRLNTLIDDPENEGDKMLLGYINQDGLKNITNFPWMQDEFENYEPNFSKVQEINQLIKGVNLQVFMGTWCEDSQREIPRLYKILNAMSFDMAKMKIAAVSHDKETPEGIEKGFNLEYVPTIIFMKDAKELNRIVEYTQGETLEDDILTILKNKAYTPAYSE